ncbi:microtubule-associated protein 1B-like [Brienomyrus brachyistius]|uniref:microtubule-associated protein 1B-like n=1 Tax=Brienomyrus brachyistius TaxID=42636 RepID=UPI0020B409B9|nr:microtubule-associated protein 1B-like [Brienomyrus brachyistius]
MAASAGPVSGADAVFPIAASRAAQRFPGSKLYLLVVIGEIVSEEELSCAIEDIGKGIRSWAVDHINYKLDQELRLFVSRHSTSSSDGKGQKTLHYRSEVLEAVVLVNPTHETVSNEVRVMVSDASRDKLLVLSGQYYKSCGGLALQSGSFSFHNFIDIFTDQEIGELLSTIHPDNRANLTLYCPDEGDWKSSDMDRHNLQDFIDLKLKNTIVLPEMDGLSEFTQHIFKLVEVPSPFDLLEPPSSGGFLKLSKPCCYVFPGGRGDATLFSVNGFNMLINGGSERKSCFWRLIRHLDRVDSILVTHVGDDNLPGINSMLQRKIAEQKRDQSQGPTTDGEWVKNFISPDLGVVFMNVPENLRKLEHDIRVRGPVEEASITLDYLDELSIKPEPLYRPSGNSLDPILLFQKMGVGKLEMYVLNPVKNSKEYNDLMKHWNDSFADKESNYIESEIPISYLTSISSLMVWHPSDPSEKIVRVLFPGNTTQQNIFEGLDMLKHLDFLKKPVVTQTELSSNFARTEKEVKMKSKSISKESRTSASRPSAGPGCKEESKEGSQEISKTASVQEVLKHFEVKQKAPLEMKTETPALEHKAETKPKQENETEKVLKTLIEKTHTKETKKEVKAKVEEKVKMEETKKKAKKDMKRDTKKDSPMKEAKKEEKKERDLKKDIRKPTRDLKKPTAAPGDAKKSVPKHRIPKKEESPRKDVGSPGKSKEKKIKTPKMEPKLNKSKTENLCAGAMVDSPDVGTEEAVESERSLMSSAEDLTKEFEELKAQGNVGYVINVAPSYEEKLKVEEKPKEAGLCEDLREFRYEPRTTTQAAEEGLESLDELLSMRQIKIGVRESEDRESVLVDLSKGVDEQETMEVKREQFVITRECEGKEVKTEVLSSLVRAETNDDVQHKHGMKPEDSVESNKLSKSGTEVISEKLTSYISKPATISTCHSASSEKASLESNAVPDKEYPHSPLEECTTLLPNTQSKADVYIASDQTTHTPIPELMSNVTTHDELKSSTELSKSGWAAPPSGHGRENMVLLPDSIKSDDSKSDVTEGQDYPMSAATLSPPSSYEDDKSYEQLSIRMSAHKNLEPGHQAALGISGKLPVDTSTSVSVFPLLKTFASDTSLKHDLLLSARDSLTEIERVISGDQNEVHTSSSTEQDDTLNGAPSSQLTLESLSGTVEALPKPQSVMTAEVTDDNITNIHIPDCALSFEKMPSPLPSPPPLESGSPSDASLYGDRKSLAELSQSSADLCQDDRKLSLPPSPLEDVKLGLFSSPVKQTSVDTLALCQKRCSEHTIEAQSEGSVNVSKDLLQVLISLDSSVIGELVDMGNKSVSEGKTSDKSDTPDSEDVEEDKISLAASLSGTTSYIPEPTSDDSTELVITQPAEIPVSASISALRNLPAPQETRIEAPKQEFPQPVSFFPTFSPSKEQVALEELLPPLKLGIECPDHIKDVHFTQESPDQTSIVTNKQYDTNGPTDVDYTYCDQELCQPENDKAEEKRSHSPTVEIAPPFSMSTFSDVECNKTVPVAAESNAQSTCKSKSQVKPEISPPSYLALSSHSFDYKDSFGTYSSSSKGYSLLYEPNIIQNKDLQNSNLESQSFPDVLNRNKVSATGYSRPDIDFCLANTCEYRDPRLELSPSFINPNPLELFAADANTDSEDDFESSPTQGITLRQSTGDPLPLSFRDGPPVPPKADTCTVDPVALTDDQHSAIKGAKEKSINKKPGLKTKPSSAARKSDAETTSVGSTDKTSKTASPRKRDLSASKLKGTEKRGKEEKNVSNIKATKATKTASLGSASGKSPEKWPPDGSPIYVDLVYIPSHGNAKNVDAEFFRRVRSSHYVVSGHDPVAEEPHKAVLDSLLEGKSQWDNNLQVTVIPTHDSEVMKQWYQQTCEEQQRLNVIVLASSSTVLMQDESFPACKIEL